MPNNSLIIDAVPGRKTEIITNPGQSLGLMLPDRQDWFTIAGRLIKHTEGTIAGKDGTRGTGKSWQKGTLTLEEALFCVQYAIGRGLNPFGDIHVWFYNQIQVCEHYRIMSGWANLRDPFTAKYFPLEASEERDRHGLSPGDIGAICYILKRADGQRWQVVYQAILTAMVNANQFDLDLAERKAYEAVAVPAIGIVTREEMSDKDGNLKRIDVRGWSWMQRAETRALRNALGRSHGTPTPAEIKAYAHKLNPGLTPAALASPDFDPSLPDNIQQKFFMLHSTQTGNESPDKNTLRRNTLLMRGDDSPIGEDYEIEDESRFITGVIDRIKWFTTPAQIKEAMTTLDLEYSPETEELIFDALARHADNEASQAAQGRLM